MSYAPKRIRKVCGHCFGSNVSCDAVVTWDEEKQAWVIDDLIGGSAGCYDCEIDCELLDEDLV